MYSLDLLIQPVTTRSPHPIYLPFRDPEGGMVTMDYQDVILKMELEGDKEKREILVCRDQLGHKVSTSNYMHFKFDSHI